MKLTISFDDLQDVTKILDKVAKKADKYKVNFKYEISEPYFKQISILNKRDNSSRIQAVKAIDINITDDIVSIDGYKVLAHIEHFTNGNVVTPILDAEIKKEWSVIDGKCDHCNTNHKRKYTYIISDGTEYKQVGKSCLYDYTGIRIDLLTSFAIVSDYVIKDIMNESSFDSLLPSSNRLYTVRNIIALAVDEINTNGYIKEGITTDKIRHSVCGGKLASDEAFNVVDNIINMVLEMPDEIRGYEWFTADYCRNAKPIIREEYCKTKHIGRLAYLPVIYKKELEKKAKIEENSKNTSHVGSIGDKITIDIKDTRCLTSYSNGFGYDSMTYVNKIVDTNNNIYIWITSKSINNATCLKGTIKEHNDFNGEKQTVLTRCKVIS